MGLLAPDFGPQFVVERGDGLISGRADGVPRPGQPAVPVGQTAQEVGQLEHQVGQRTVIAQPVFVHQADEPVAHLGVGGVQLSE